MSTVSRDYVEVDHLTKRFGSVTAVDDVSFSIRQGEIMTLLGPSGCGKSTTLRCVAGLERMEQGEIRVGGQLVSSAAERIFVPPEHRQLGMVFQSYAVWPHMTVWGNVAYPLEVCRFPKNEIAGRVQRMLELVGLADQAQRNVTKLSGGQQQRVVLARALVHNPRVLLLDEPLSNLDARLRETMRFEIRNVQQEIGITALYVTHDQAEAMVISDRVIVMNRGKIEQLGHPLEIYRRPANRFVAAFFGSVNFIHGTVAAVQTEGPCASVEVSVNGETHLIDALLQPGIRKGEKATVCIRPHELDLISEPPGGSRRGVFKGRIARVVRMGSYVEYHIDVGDLVLHCQTGRDAGLTVGSSVHVMLRSNEATCVAS